MADLSRLLSESASKGAVAGVFALGQRRRSVSLSIQAGSSAVTGALRYPSVATGPYASSWEAKSLRRLKARRPQNHGDSRFLAGSVHWTTILCGPVARPT